MINQGIASLVATSECSLLATAIVLVYNSSSDSLEVRALLDSGSQFNFITKNGSQIKIDYTAFELFHLWHR